MRKIDKMKIFKAEAVTIDELKEKVIFLETIRLK